MSIDLRHGTSHPRSAAAGPADDESPCARHRRISAEARVVHDAAALSKFTTAEALRAMDEAHAFLVDAFIPHAAEEARLRERLARRDYRCLEERPGEVEIEQLTARLAGAKARVARRADTEAIREVRTVLHELSALVTIHFHDLEPSYRRTRGIAPPK